MRTLIIFLLLLLALIVPTKKMKADPGKPKTRKLVLAITDNGAGTRIKAITPIAAYLSNALQMEVTTTTAKRAVDLLKLMENQEVDIAFINSFGYVLGMADTLPIAPLVLAGNADGSPGTYNSCIISAPSKGITSMEQLTKNAHDVSFLFVNATSASGHLVPRLYLSKLGIPQAETAFKELSFAENHYATLEKIIAGEVDAGAVAYNILESKIASGEIRKEDVRILWVSEPITQTPAIINSKLDQDLKDKIEEAFLQLHEKDPALWKQVQVNFSARNSSNFVKAKDEYYNSIRNVSGNIEDLLFILNYYID